MRSTGTVAFHTLGCKLNFSETSTLARSLEEAGYARVKVEERPDVFVLNTCSVTENADKECRQWVRKFQRINPEGFVAVVGCYAQLKPQEIAAIPGVDLVLGANEKFDLAAHLEALEGKQVEGRAIFGAIKEVKHFSPSWSAGDRTRTFLKVQDGCDYFCSFCTIPLARGRSRSGTIAETVAQAKAIAATGVKEIVITGVNTGDFGKRDVTLTPDELRGPKGDKAKVMVRQAHHDNNERETFLQLIEALDKVKGIERFRISSIEPNLCHDGIIDFVAASERFVPHFHMPLQSGSDVILQRMRRRYDTALYAERAARIKQRMPDACIGVDVITGTPGETEEEFLKTHEFLRDTLRHPSPALRAGSQGDNLISYLHVFTYSERANTTAVRMEDVVPMEVRRERTKQLRILSSKLQRAFYEKHLGRTRRVLFEAAESEGHMEGYTENYIRVTMPYDASLVNRVVPVHLGRINIDGHVIGTLAVPELMDTLIA